MSDEEVLDALLAELNRRDPRGCHRLGRKMLSHVRALPKGLRAMAATYYLDVNLALDNLGWHFINDFNRDFWDEAHAGLLELGASRLAELFLETSRVAGDFAEELQRLMNDPDFDDWHRWYLSSGYGERVESMSREAHKLVESLPMRSVFQYWVDYARQHPDVLASGCTAARTRAGRKKHEV